jgi:hypothetical protein
MSARAARRARQRRLMEAMLTDVPGIEISLVRKYPESLGRSEPGVAQPIVQLQEQLPRQAVLNVDETGWRTNGDKAGCGAWWRSTLSFAWWPPGGAPKCWSPCWARFSAESCAMTARCLICPTFRSHAALVGSSEEVISARMRPVFRPQRPAQRTTF